MGHTDVVHPIEQLLDDEHEAIKAFADAHPDIWQFTNTAAALSQLLLTTAADTFRLSSAEGLRILLWQSILKYQFESLRFIIKRELDPAYTLLRNATELTRDIANIAADASKADAWLKSKLAGKRDATFKFDEKDSQQAYVYRLYKMTSDWGTHGHFSVLLFGELVGLVGNDEALEMRRISNTGVNEALTLWLAGFFPMQFLCAEQFIKEHPAEFKQYWPTFLEFGDLAGKLITGLRAVGKQ